MKKLGFVLFMLAMALMLTGSALAQNVGDNSVYFVTYYSNANTTGAADEVVRIVNDGDLATSAPEGVENGPIWADFYIFDDSEELQSCCSCLVTADGLLSESVNKELTNDEFTGRAEITRGVIKVVADTAGNATAPVPAPGLHGWATHVQATTNANAGAVNVKPAGPWFVTETPLADANLGKIELSNLATSCSYGITLGSGYGQCSCTPEDHDF
jgi:hypothetical protein